MQVVPDMVVTSWYHGLQQPTYFDTLFFSTTWMTIIHKGCAIHSHPLHGTQKMKKKNSQSHGGGQSE